MKLLEGVLVLTLSFKLAIASQQIRQMRRHGKCTLRKNTGWMVCNMVYNTTSQNK